MQTGWEHSFVTPNIQTTQLGYTEGLHTRINIRTTIKRVTAALSYIYTTIPLATRRYVGIEGKKVQDTFDVSVQWVIQYFLVKCLLQELKGS